MKLLLITFLYLTNLCFLFFRMRHKNNLAVTKSRCKKRSAYQQMVVKFQILKQENDKLSAKIEERKNKISKLEVQLKEKLRKY